MASPYNVSKFSSNYREMYSEDKQDIYMQLCKKETIQIDEKPFGQDSIELIEKCAENGTWVLVSTLRFPSFWKEVLAKLKEMEEEDRILNTFRLFIDL